MQVNLIASISNQGSVRFMLYTHKLTAQVLIVFMERSIRKARRKVFWIVDRHPVHRCDAVQQWLEDHKSQIECFTYPPTALS